MGLRGLPLVYSHQLNVRVTDKVVKALKQKADRDGIRVSQIMRILLIAYLQGKITINGNGIKK